MKNEKEFLFWESSSRDTIDFKMVYVDIANGDLVSGLLLSQIIYWFLPSKSSLSKLTETNGVKQLIKKRGDWFKEIRITEKQYDRAVAILEKLNLIKVELKKSNYYDGAPVPHIQLNFGVLIDLLNNQRGKSILTKGENPSYPNGEIDIPGTVKTDIPERSKSIDTEITPEITTKITTEIKEEKKNEFPSQEKVSKFFEHHLETVKKSASRETEMFNVDKLGILLDWSIEEYDKVLYTKQNSSWEPRRKQPNTARWLIATLQNEALMSPSILKNAIVDNTWETFIAWSKRFLTAGLIEEIVQVKANLKDKTILVETEISDRAKKIIEKYFSELDTPVKLLISK